MTRKDFTESLNAVLVENLEETLTPAELSKISKEIVARVDIDWDPFESSDPLGVDLEGDDNDTPEESDSFCFNPDDED